MVYKNVKSHTNLESMENDERNNRNIFSLNSIILLYYQIKLTGISIVDCQIKSQLFAIVESVFEILTAFIVLLQSQTCITVLLHQGIAHFIQLIGEHVVSSYSSSYLVWFTTSID